MSRQAAAGAANAGEFPVPRRKAISEGSVGVKLECRFHLSSLEVRRKDGQVFFVPWPEILIDERYLRVPRKFVDGHRRSAMKLCLNGRAIDAARRLRERAAWRAERIRIQCPTVRRTLSIAGAFSAAILVLFLAMLALVTHRAWMSPRGSWAADPSEMDAVAIVFAMLFGILILAATAAPFAAVWPYVRFRWRHRDLTGLYAAPDALVYERLDGAETRLPWARLVRFDSRGRIDFEDSLESPLQICIVSNAGWVVLRDRLRRTHPQAFVSPLAFSEFARFLVPLTIAAVIGEVIVAIAMRLLGTDDVPPGRLLLAAGVLAASCSIQALLVSYEQTSRRRGRKRRRVSRAPTKSDQ